jgi:hypothetical protein
MKLAIVLKKTFKKKISNAGITIHFEPNWKNVPLDGKILEIAKKCTKELRKFIM